MKIIFLKKLYNKNKIIVNSLLISLFFCFFYNLCSPLNLYFHWGSLNFDPNHYLNIGLALLDGQIPYKDIVDNKGPLVPFIMALVWLLGFKTFYGVFIFGILNYTVFCFFTYKIFLLKFNFKISTYWIITIILFICGLCLLENQISSIMLEEVILPFQVISIFLFLKYDFKIPTKKIFFIQGVLFACIFYIRQNALIVPLSLTFIYIYLMIKEFLLKK